MLPASVDSPPIVSCTGTQLPTIPSGMTKSIRVSLQSSITASTPPTLTWPWGWARVSPKPLPSMRTASPGPAPAG